MKNFSQNLLIVLAACLCGLCAWQWYVQSVQRVTIEHLTGDIAERDAALRSATNSIRSGDHQVAQMDAQITALKAAAKTNGQLIATQQREIQKMKTAGDALNTQIAEYQKAVDVLNAKFKDASAGIEKQNTTISQLVAQRDELVAKFNAAAKDRNEVVAKYNALVKQVEEMQKAVAPEPETK